MALSRKGPNLDVHISKRNSSNQEKVLGDKRVTTFTPIRVDEVFQSHSSSIFAHIQEKFTLSYYLLSPVPITV